MSINTVFFTLLSKILYTSCPWFIYNFPGNSTTADNYRLSRPVSQSYLAPSLNRYPSLHFDYLTLWPPGFSRQSLLIVTSLLLFLYKYKYYITPCVNKNIYFSILFIVWLSFNNTHVMRAIFVIILFYWIISTSVAVHFFPI